MIRKSVSIHPEQETSLLAYLVKKFGMPVCYEDLTIYFVSDELSVKLSIQPLESLFVSFRNSAGEELYSYNTRPEEIKDVVKSLMFVSKGLGYISISTVKKFMFGDGEYISIIRTSDAGTVCSFYCKNSRVINEISRKFELSQRPSSQAPIESIIGYDVSEDGILNSKVLQYLERNGIFYKSNNGQPTYRDLMHSKSNDYSLYESAFEMVTGRSIVDSRCLTKGQDYVKGRTASLIIPAMNSASTILKVLASIEAQNGLTSFASIEVIIIDDNSTTPLAEEHDFEKMGYSFSLRIVRTEKNVGVSVARKIGTALSSGELLFYMDSDILLEKNYLIEHTARMLAIPNAVFVSLRGRIDDADPRISIENIKQGLEKPSLFHDLRVHKKVEPNRSVGAYKLQSSLDLNILESTNFLKSFNGSKVYGVYDLSCMVAGHNFSTRRANIENAKPFSHLFKGWGMEDVYAGLRFIGYGIYIVPVISTGVYHIDHPPRSGSAAKKNEEYLANIAIINTLLDAPFER